MANTKKTAKEVLQEVREKSEQTIGIVSEKMTDAKEVVKGKIESQPAVAERVKDTKAGVAKVVEGTKTSAQRAVSTSKRMLASSKIKAIHVQYQGKEITESAIIERIVAAYTAAGKKKTAIRELEVYLKPEESTAYYVINGDETGSVPMF